MSLFIAVVLIWLLALTIWLAGTASGLSRELRELRRRFEETSRPRETSPHSEAASETTAAGAGTIEGGESLMAPVQPASPPPLPPPLPTRRFARPVDWEMFMGAKLFAWLGGLALFLGVVFLVKYSFEHDLISPALRVVFGYVIGIALLAGGIHMERRKYAITAQTLCATGIVVLYAVTFSGHAIYRLELFTTWMALLLMAAITVAGFVIAVRLEARVVAVLGMLGGFLTPILLSTGEDNTFGLFSYVALLNAGLIAVALKQRWHFLVGLGALGTVVMQLGWLTAFFEPDRVFAAMTIFLVFNLMFNGTFWIAEKMEQRGRWLFWPGVGTAFVSIGIGFYLLGYESLGARPQWVLSFGLLSFLPLLLPAVGRTREAAPLLAGGIATFLLLATWIVRYLDVGLLRFALIFTLLFAAVHSIVPLALQKRPRLSVPRWYSQLFPPAAVALLLWPVVRMPEFSFYVWPVAVLLNLLGMTLAILLGSFLLLLGMLVLTVIAAAAWLFSAPASVTVLPEILLVTAGFGSLFFFAAFWAAKRFQPQNRETRPGGESSLLLDLPGITALSAVLPFVLLLFTLLHLPVGNPSAVFGTGLFLLLLILMAAFRFQAHWASGAGLACVAAMQYLWHAMHFEPAMAGLALSWYSVFYLCFLVYPFARREMPWGGTGAWIASALAGPVHFPPVYWVIGTAYPNDVMGLLPALFAVPSLAATWLAAKRIALDDPGRSTALAWLAGVSLFFITLIFPIQFEKQWITIGWAVEGTALLWLFHRLPHPGLRIAGIGMLIVVFVRLALNPMVFDYQRGTGMPILNWHLYTYGIATVCLLIGARLLAPPRNIVLDRNAPPLLYTLGVILAFFLVNLQIADYFGEGHDLTLEFGGNFARDMTYTIAWAAFALMLLVVGIWKHSKGTRRAGLGLLGVTLLKLFVHDLANLSQLYRIGALVAVAIVAIVASFLYQRFPGSERRASAKQASSEQGTPGV